MNLPPRVMAERLIKKYEDEAERLLTEKHRLRWLWILALTTWPIGLIWMSWKICLTLFSGWLTFWFTGLYLNWVHRWENHDRLQRSREKLEALPPDDSLPPAQPVSSP